MSIAAQCPACCTCPVPALKFEPGIDVSFVSNSAESAELCGFAPFFEEEEGECTRYRKKAVTGEFFDPVLDPENPCDFNRKYVFSGEVSYGEGSCSIDTYALFNSWKEDPPDCILTPESVDSPVSQINGPTVSVTFGPCEPGSQTSGTYTSATELSVVGCYTPEDGGFTGSGSEVLSEEDTLAAAILRSPGTIAGTLQCAETGERFGCLFGASTSVTMTITVTGLPSTTYTITIFYRNYSGTPPVEGDPTSETVEIETDGDGIAEIELDIPQPDPGFSRCFDYIESDNYRWIFQPPKTGTGTCYRVEWIERVIPDGGASIDSLEVKRPGCYRPSVSIETPFDIIEAVAVPVMAPDGSVAGMSLLNPGGPYLVAPTVTFEAAINGGTTAEATAILNASGQITGFVVTNPGDYLPDVGFSPVIVTGAVASVTMDSQGGIATAILTDGGSEYGAVSVGLVEKCTVTATAVIIPHYGTETVKCAVWDGEVPEDYEPDDQDTWPSIPSPDAEQPFYTLPTGASVEEFSAYCDCAPCEEES